MSKGITEPVGEHLAIRDFSLSASNDIPRSRERERMSAGQVRVHGEKQFNAERVGVRCRIPRNADSFRQELHPDLKADFVPVRIPFEFKEIDIRALFEPFGRVELVELPPSPAHSGKNRGFGFVVMRSKAEALKAIQKLNGQRTMLGRRLQVHEAEKNA